MHSSFSKIILISIFMIMGISISSCKSHNNEEIKPTLPISMMIWGRQYLSSPLNIKVSDELISEFSAEDYNSDGHHPVEQMLLKWDQAYPQVQFFKMPTDSVSNKDYTNLSEYNDSEMGVYISHDWFSDVSSSALAVTQFYGVKKNTGNFGFLELIHADIIMNYRDHSFSLDPDDVGAYYMPSVLLHEMGHLIGQSHQRNFATPSIMQPFLSTFDDNTEVTQADISVLTNNYNMTPTINSSTSLAILSQTTSHKEGDIIRGVIELHADGSCHHKLNGKLTKIHPANSF